MVGSGRRYAPHSGFRRFGVLAVLLATVILPGGSVAAQVTCAEAAPAPASTPAATPAHASPADVPFPEGGGDMTVFAAASLTDAFATIVDNLEAANPGLAITVQTGGSQELVTQLAEGAEADVLATANTATMATAVENGSIAGEPITFTGNRLVIVTPLDNPATVTSLDDLAQGDMRLVIAAEAVPVGSYARGVLCTYAAQGGAPDGFIDGLNGNVVSEEPDVRSVLAKVQLGEADAGIVYASDAVAAQQTGDPVSVIEFPEGLDTTAVYPIAPVAGGDAVLAAAFIAYMLSPEGQAVLAGFGFSTAH